MTRFNAFAGAMPASVRAPRAARELRRLGKFAVVGLSHFIVDFAVLNLLMFRLGLPAWEANTCSFTAAVSNTFIWNRLWNLSGKPPAAVDDPARPVFPGQLGWPGDQHADLPGQPCAHMEPFLRAALEL